MNNQVNYDKTEIFKKELKPMIEEIDKLCAIHGIPYFGCYCVKSNETETVYEKKLLSSTALERSIRDSIIESLVLVTEGFTVSPPHIDDECKHEDITYSPNVPEDG